MKAVVQDSYGPPDVLLLRDVSVPVPRDDEVLVRVRAAGVGPDVWHLMAGIPYAVRLAFGLRRPRNPVPGWDVAGVVEDGGASGFQAGDEVFGVGRGTFAEFASVRASRLAHKPAGIGFDQAAALPVSGQTALQALRDQARVQAGQRVLVVGASGGVGTFAIQLATALGAEVTGVCGPSGADLVRELGAVDVIDYTQEEITDRDVRYDVIVDIAGNRPLSLLRRLLTPRGALVLVGGEDGGKVLGMGRTVGAKLTSPFVGQRILSFISGTSHENLAALAEFAEKGAVRPVVDRTFALAEAADAVRHLRQGHPRGKVVITV